MAKKSNTSLRAQLAAQRAAEEAARQRRRMIGVGALVAMVLIAIVAIFIVVAQNKPSTSPSAAAGGSYVQLMQTVPAASLDAVGVGSARNTAQVIPDGKVALKDGKPRVLYVGADYCPYCGIERWALVIALSRFGTFEGLKAGLSSPDEGAASNIPTVFFTGTTYKSSYLTFDAVELADRLGAPLAKPSADDQKLLDTYDPGTTGNPIPWIYWGTQHQIGASFQGAKFMPNVPGDAVAAKLSDPASEQAQAILGAANIHTARLCTLTGQQPANVCTSAGVQAAAKVLG